VLGGVFGGSGSACDLCLVWVIVRREAARSGVGNVESLRGIWLCKVLMT
jgi:hypothetical protein